MTDDNDFPKPGIKELPDELRQEVMSEDLEDATTLLERVYLLWQYWSDFHLYITTPDIVPISPPLIVKPEHLEGSSDHEYVYTIYDYGYRLSTSKNADMFVAGMSMCKLYYTIEKMISMLVERLKSGGIDMETEVQVAFHGHELAQRKAFESVINLSYNVVVTNFDPGAWGENYLETVKRMANKGYGYPSEAPRNLYKQNQGDSLKGIKR